MSLTTQTALITSIMALCFVAPRLSQRIESQSKTLLLIGTGGLVSLYFADLLPDVVHLGGARSLGIILIVWLIYSALNLLNIKHHEHDEHVHTHLDLSRSSALLMGSMILHCFSSGMLLFMSHELSARIAATVFLAIIGHKGYEALSVSVLLSQKTESRRKFAFCAGAYAASFPIGVLATALLTHAFSATTSPEIVRTVAVLVASLAVGSLAGCMVQDFLLPSLRHVRTRRLEAAWLLVGVGLTLVFTLGVPG